MKSKEEVILSIKKLFENCSMSNIKVSDVLSDLNLSKLFNIKAKTKFPINSIINLYVFRYVKGFYNYEDLISYLTKNQNEAILLGFYNDKKNNLLLPPKRTFNNYLKDLDISLLKELAENILSIATKNNIILDLEIVRKSVEKKKKDSSKEIRETVKLIKKLVYPKINIYSHHNVKFSTSDLLDVLTHVASHHDFANNGSSVFKELYPERKTPSGDVLMYRFSKLNSYNEIKAMFDKVLDYIFKYAKKNYNLLKHRKLDIAYDIHKIPYYGKDMIYTKKGKSDRGTTEFFEFLTCSIVEDGRRFVLDAVPIHPLNDISELLDKSLEKIKKKVLISKVYCDRGFNSIKIFKVLRKHKVKYLMPMTRNPSVKAVFDKAEACKARIFEEFQMGRGENSEKVNLVLVDDDQGVKRAFVCNFNIGLPIAYHLFYMYGKRWGIETSYRNLDHDFKPRTTSNNYNIRLFYFFFSCCLYNIWILVNICVGLSCYGRLLDKPPVTAKLFAVLLYKVKENLA